MKFLAVRDPAAFFDMVQQCAGSVTCSTPPCDLKELARKVQGLGGLVRLAEIPEMDVQLGDPSDRDRMVRFMMDGHY